MKINLLVTLFFLVFAFFCGCDTTEPEFNPDKIFIEVKNGTVDSDGEFEVFNYSGESIFIHHYRSFCYFFTYSMEQSTDTGWARLSFNPNEGKWMTPVFIPDSIVVCIDEIKLPIELKYLSSFKQKISGLNQTGDYRLTTRYTQSNESKSYFLMADYKVSH